MHLKLDDLDFKILIQLQRNARLSDKEISRIIHLSPNAVTARIKRLEDDAYIHQYTTVLNKTMFNRKLECFTGVTLTHNNFHTVSSFLIYIKNIPEVGYYYHINSDMFDFLIHIIAVDIQDYYRILNDRLSCLNCVGRVTSFTVLNEVTGLNNLDLTHLIKRGR